MGAANSTDFYEEEEAEDVKPQKSGVKLPNSKLVVVLLYSFMSLAIFFNLRVIYIVVGILFKRGPSAQRHGVVSNQHAFIYVLCLSIVDALVLAHLPLVVTDILINWVFGSVVCKFYWIAEQLNRILSTFFLAALSGDRFLAVCYPFRCRAWRTTKAAVVVVSLCVVVAGFLLTPTYLYSIVKVYPFGDDNRTLLKCIFDMDTSTSHQFLIYIFATGYCIPFISMVYFYGCMLRTLWKGNSTASHLESNAAEMASRTQRGLKRAQHVTQRALILVLFYFGCWTPYWLLQFYVEFIYDSNSPPSQLQADALFISMYVVHALTYLNSAVNPFLYALLNKELQQQHSSTTSSMHVPNIQSQSSCNSTQRRNVLTSETSPLKNKSTRNYDDNGNFSPGLMIRRCLASRKISEEEDQNAMPLLRTPTTQNHRMPFRQQLEKDDC